MNYYLRKERLDSFLKVARQDFCLIGPKQADNEDFLFQETKDLDSIDLNYDITSNTIKEFFFPATETIFGYQRKRSGSFKLIPAQEKSREETIFWGLRSCDIRAVYFQDYFFGQEPKDSLYRRKRSKSILISFGCNMPRRQSCFCAYTKSGPFLEKEQGFDLQLIDLTEDYLVEVGTQKGKNLIKKYKQFFTLATEDVLRRKLLLKNNCLLFAKCAGILAAKRVDALIPLCHPLALEHVEIGFKLEKKGILIQARCKARAKTGVEMEAMAAASVSALTIYDMCKSIDRGAVIEQIQLVEKKGGKSGHYKRT